MIGYQVKSNPTDGVINLKAKCAGSGSGTYFTEGGEIDPGVGSYPASFTSCQKGEAINGIRTIVDTRSKGGNLRGVIEVELKCTKVPPLGSNGCKVNVGYDLILECNNLYGNSTLQCEYEETTGISKEDTKGTVKRHTDETLMSIGISLEAQFKFLTSTVKDDVTWTNLVGSSDESSSSKFWQKETTNKATLDVPPESIQRLYQVTAHCDQFDVKSDVIYSSDIKGPIANPPDPGLVCQDPV